MKYIISQNFFLNTLSLQSKWASKRLNDRPGKAELWHQSESQRKLKCCPVCDLKCRLMTLASPSHPNSLVIELRDSPHWQACLLPNSHPPSVPFEMTIPLFFFLDHPFAKKSSESVSMERVRGGYEDVRWDIMSGTRCESAFRVGRYGFLQWLWMALARFHVIVG